MTRRGRKITAAAGGVALRMAGKKYLGLPTASPAHAAALASSLGNLKGPVMKIAQFLATIPGLLPDDYMRILGRLQTNAPPMGKHLVMRRMRGELGEGWPSRFADFELEPHFAASLGQVHLARGHGGEKLACKLQYPGMAEAVAGDLAQMETVLRIVEKWSGALRVSSLAEEIGARLAEELDYRREACAMHAFSRMLASEGKIAVPEPVAELSTGALLTMSWLDGTPLLELPQEARNEAARLLFRAWYLPLLHAGILHGDPHPGNYTLAADGTLNLLDFGCIRIFPPRFVKGVVDLWKALLAKDDAGMDAAFGLWGFAGLNVEAQAALRNWAAFLYDALIDDKVRPIGTLDAKGLYGREIAAETHRALKKAGGVTIPPEFVFIDRAALGLGSVFLRLRATLNWHREFAALAEGFDEKSLARKQHAILAQSGL